MGAFPIFDNQGRCPQSRCNQSNIREIFSSNGPRARMYSMMGFKKEIIFLGSPSSRQESDNHGFESRVQFIRKIIDYAQYFVRTQDSRRQLRSFKATCRIESFMRCSAGFAAQARRHIYKQSISISVIL